MVAAMLFMPVAVWGSISPRVSRSEGATPRLGRGGQDSVRFVFCQIPKKSSLTTFLTNQRAARTIGMCMY